MFNRLREAKSACLLHHLPTARWRSGLSGVSPERAREIKSLRRDPENSTGGIMKKRFITVRDNMSLEQIREWLRARAEEECVENITYLHVTDA